MIEQAIPWIFILLGAILTVLAWEERDAGETAGGLIGIAIGLGMVVGRIPCAS